MLCRALRVTASPDSTVIERARIYGYDAVASAEHERAAPELNRSSNPRNLVAVPPNGTYYPTGEFTAIWGKLSVDGGALVLTYNRSLRVSVPIDPAARPLKGDGWTLVLNKGWTLRQGSKGFEIVPN